MQEYNLNRKIQRGGRRKKEKCQYEVQVFTHSFILLSQLSSTTLCLCSSLLIVAVHSAVTPKPADSKPAIDSDADPAKPAVTSSTSSTSSSSKSAAKSVTPKSAPAVKSEAPAKSATKAPAAAPSKATSSVSDDELDKLLQDRRYLSRQLKCALGEGVCDPVGRRLKCK
ncbi:chromodomain-helicase-DNA-binding protein 9-like [Diaphorina citri]|uniref:Chromodomain-helicase-DNA-binding protein 9-like n=1 Tax=Diaphorina citri TaxID=121845 RepID=A0A3Q0JJ61_DIACI|nr:chromodomain-helicase-DNA-binding protein 9-like [Diaphorina citri]